MRIAKMKYQAPKRTNNVRFIIGYKGKKYLFNDTTQGYGQAIRKARALSNYYGQNVKLFDIGNASYYSNMDLTKYNYDTIQHETKARGNHKMSAPKKKKTKITCKHCGLGTTNKDKICAKCKAHIKRLKKADERAKARDAKTNAKAKAKYQRAKKSSEKRSAKYIAQNMLTPSQRRKKARLTRTGRIATTPKLTGRTQKTPPRTAKKSKQTGYVYRFSKSKGNIRYVGVAGKV